MAIYVDSIVTHDTDNSGNDTVPPGISGQDWCHIVSDSSFFELFGFLTFFVLSIGQSPTNIRTPLLGSLITYAGLNADMRAAAVAAGAIEKGRLFVVSHSFDSGDSSLYEPA